MRYSEHFIEHIEYAFNAFCKTVLRHEAINAWREISLDYLMSERYFEPSAMDSYFENNVGAIPLALDDGLSPQN